MSRDRIIKKTSAAWGLRPAAAAPDTAGQAAGLESVCMGTGQDPAHGGIRPVSRDCGRSEGSDGKSSADKKPTVSQIKKGERRSPATEFKPGQKPWNTGKKGWSAGGRSVETRFKKGEMRGAAQHNYVPIGTLRLSKDGYLERKTTDDPNIYPARRWVAVHRLVWIAHNGPIPPKHIVAFKPGMRTQDPDQITIDRLQLISLVDNMKRNHWKKTLPPEVASLVQLKGAIARQVNRITREKEEASKQ